MLKSNVFMKEQNVIFSLDKNKEETWVEIEKNLLSTEDFIALFMRLIYKVGGHIRGWPKGSLFDNYYIKV